jgi:biopolymer transport protein ExbD
MGVELEIGKKRGKGKRGGKVKPAINVTPLVDVVLVLLIIFMVVTPLMTKKLSVNVPVKSEGEPPPPDPNEEPQVILTVNEAGTIYINKDEISDAELPQKLQRIFAARSDQTLFFDAADSAEYGRAMEVLDLARGAKIMTIAVLTEPVLRN